MSNVENFNDAANTLPMSYRCCTLAIITTHNVSWRFSDVDGGSVVFEIQQPSVAP